MNDYKELKECLACGSANMKPYLHLGLHPLANNYSDLPEESINQTRYPLELQVCKNCWHSQLTIAVDPKKMFEDYQYVSGTSNTLNRYFDRFVREVSIDYCDEEHKNVLDIASNDGTLLKYFKKYGWGIQGIDPAKNLIEISDHNQVPTMPDYFNLEKAKEMKTVGHRYSLIVAQNVLAHVSDPLDFLLGCKLLVDYNGYTYIQTSQAYMVPRVQFDTAYHEHLSYFTAGSMIELAHRSGLFVADISTKNIHGTSFLFKLSRRPCNETNALSRAKKNDLEYKTNKIETYDAFRTKTSNMRFGLGEVIEKADKPLVGFAAAAKGMTVIHYNKLYSFDYFVDENELKWDKYLPGTNIHIMNPDRLYTDKRDLCILVTAWNFFDEIKEKIKAARPDRNDTIIRYFPKLEVVDG